MDYFTNGLSDLIEIFTIYVLNTDIYEFIIKMIINNNAENFRNFPQTSGSFLFYLIISKTQSNINFFFAIRVEDVFLYNIMYTLSQSTTCKVVKSKFKGKFAENYPHFNQKIISYERKKIDKFCFWI